MDGEGRIYGTVWYAMIVLILMPNAGEVYNDAEPSMSCDVVRVDNRYVDWDGRCRRKMVRVHNVQRGDTSLLLMNLRGRAGGPTLTYR